MGDDARAHVPVGVVHGHANALDHVLASAREPAPVRNPNRGIVERNRDPVPAIAVKGRGAVIDGVGHGHALDREKVLVHHEIVVIARKIEQKTKIRTSRKTNPETKTRAGIRKRRTVTKTRIARKGRKRKKKVTSRVQLKILPMRRNRNELAAENRSLDHHL